MLVSTLFHTLFLVGIIVIIHYVNISIKGLGTLYDQHHFATVDEIDTFSFQTHSANALRKHILFIIKISSLFVVTSFAFIESSYVIGITTYILLLSALSRVILTDIEIPMQDSHYIISAIIINCTCTPIASILSFFASLAVYIQYVAHESEQIMDKIGTADNDDVYSMMD